MMLIDRPKQPVTRITLEGTGKAAHASAELEHGAPVQHVALLLDPSQLRGIHGELKSRLERGAGVRVSLLRARAQQPLPRSVDLMLDLERLIYRLPGPCLGSRLDFDQSMLDKVHPDDPLDLIVDLCGSEFSPPGGRTIRLTYDGMAGWSPLIGALIAGRMPTIELMDIRTNTVIARGVPCADNAGTISEALQCVLARVATLVISTARGRATLAPELLSQPQPARLPRMAAAELKAFARGVIGRLYRLCCHSPHWRTCWRFLEGPDLWATRSLSGTSWNVIPDPGFRFYADPFPFVHEGKTYVFVEDLDHRHGKAVISVVRFDERGPTGPARPVLEEPWHLSYPFVFAHGGQVWMIPESSAGRCVTLYRADPFPDRWIREETLVSGIEASDATVIRHGGSFWMFAATRDGAGSWSDTLSIFSAPDLRGPWEPHSLNPVLVDQRAARPAGAMMVRDGKLWRPVQDCTDGYGTGVGLVEVMHLDHDRFEQRVHAVLRADPNWPGRRFHTLNRAGRLECIDGSAYSPRSRHAARWLETWSGRREPPEY